MSYDVNKIRKLIRQLKSGHITIDRIRSRINVNLGEQFSTATSTKGISYSTDEERSGYLHYLIIFTQEKSIATRLEYDMGIKNIDYDRIAALLDTHNLNDGNPNYIVTIFPIYCRRINLRRDDVGKLAARYDLHKSFINHCSAIMKRSSQPVRFVEIRVAEHIDVNGEISTVTIPKTFEVLPDDKISVEIAHDNLVNIEENSIDTDGILEAPYNYDILLDSFQLFQARDNLKEYLISKKDDKYQVLAATWLLGLIGFRIIPFGILDKNHNENILEKQTKTQFSADILAEDSGLLLVVDCTVSVTPQDKIVKILNTVKHITARLNETVTPVIFSAANCLTLKDNARSVGVHIIDSQNLDFLCDLILKGHIASVRDTFLRYFTLGQTVAITRFRFNRNLGTVFYLPHNLPSFV
jgi:hypothetical protein